MLVETVDSLEAAAPEGSIAVQEPETSAQEPAETPAQGSDDT